MSERGWCRLCDKLIGIDDCYMYPLEEIEDEQVVYALKRDGISDPICFDCADDYLTDTNSSDCKHSREDGNKV